MGMVGGQFFLLFPAVIGVKIDEHSLGLEQAVPLSVGLLQMGQRPGQVPADDGIKGAGSKSGVFPVHHLKICGQTQIACRLPGFVDHLRGQIDAGDLVALGGQQNGKKAGSCADVQNAQLFLLWQVSLQFRKPKMAFFAG